jgi:5-formyltetrahydrofolate cyclo-ligase
VDVSEGSSSPADQKRAVRTAVWDRLTREALAAFPLPVRGRIPNFKGAAEAALRLTSEPEFEQAQVIKVNPDAPQRNVRLLALRAGKTLLVPTPRLREGFLLLDPEQIGASRLAQAATIRGAATYGRAVALDALPRPDLIVLGTVAVSGAGSRVGKGEGFAELEYATLREMGRVSADVPIATTVHDIQVVEAIPSEPWDVPVDVIATPTRVIRTETRLPRPAGIYWEHLAEERLATMPILRELRERRRLN